MILRCRNDDFGPGQHWATLFIKETEGLYERGCTLTVRWVPGHANVPGSEAADEMAKGAAANRRKPGQEHATYRVRITASMTYLKRTATERKAAETNGWIKEKIRQRHQVSGRHSYTPPKKSGSRKMLKKERKRLAARFYQLNTGHALTAPYMKRIKKTDSNLCWWCEDGRSIQTRQHLFTECRAFKPQIKRLWKSVGKQLNWRHPRSKRIPSFQRRQSDGGGTGVFERYRGRKGQNRCAGAGTARGLLGGRGTGRMGVRIRRGT